MAPAREGLVWGGGGTESGGSAVIVKLAVRLAPILGEQEAAV